MKGAIATVDFFISESEDPSKSADRFSLVIAAPERSPSGDGWQCRVALADLVRPEIVIGRDSFEALALAVGQAHVWIGSLRTQGRVLTRDRAGEIPFELP